MGKRPWRDEEVWRSYVPRKDKHGSKLCEMHGCPNLLKGRQERWCSQKCVFDALATHDWSVCRKRILKRDDHKCVQCKAMAWEVDHILPLIEGGKLCDPANLRTLCSACHKIETAALAKRRADARRERIIAEPPPLFSSVTAI